MEGCAEGGGASLTELYPRHRRRARPFSACPGPHTAASAVPSNASSAIRPLFCSLRLMGGAAEAARFGGDPDGELLDLRMGAQALDGAVVALQFFFREHGVDLRMAGAAD